MEGRSGVGIGALCLGAFAPLFGVSDCRYGNVRRACRAKCRARCRSRRLAPIPREHVVWGRRSADRDSAKAGLGGSGVDEPRYRADVAQRALLAGLYRSAPNEAASGSAATGHPWSRGRRGSRRASATFASSPTHGASAADVVSPLTRVAVPNSGDFGASRRVRPAWLRCAGGGIDLRRGQIVVIGRRAPHTFRVPGQGHCGDHQRQPDAGVDRSCVAPRCRAVRVVVRVTRRERAEHRSRQSLGVGPSSRRGCPLCRLGPGRDRCRHIAGHVDPDGGRGLVKAAEVSSPASLAAGTQATAAPERDRRGGRGRARWVLRRFSSSPGREPPHSSDLYRW